MDPADIHPLRRRQLGAWYTPAPLVEAVVRAVLPDDLVTGVEYTVLDPACGDGRFLAEAARQLAERGVTARLTGVDIDPDTARATRRHFGSAATIVCADALARAWSQKRFDLVIGNPPFLSQMSSLTARGGKSSFGGGAYADTAAEFLALATDLARPDGGRVGLVLPLSVMATRDARPIRARVLQQAALEWFWWSPRSVFDAQIRTCAVGLVRPAGARQVIRRVVGKHFEPQSDFESDDLQADQAWSALLSDQLGVPPLPALSVDGVLADRATVTADFRDQYYGLVGAVGDDFDGPPLVTSGLIDPAKCWWGERPIKFAKTPFLTPRVDLERLTPKLRHWAARRLVPKVIVASQTKVIEAVVDELGEWLPGVPVVSVIPNDPAEVWTIAALLTSPVASAWLAAQMAGSGMSAAAIRVPAATLSQLPMPASTSSNAQVDEAAAALRDGDLAACGRAVTSAYGLTGDSADELFEWWLSRIDSRR